MVDHAAAAASGPIVQRIEAALVVVEALQNGKARYCVSNPVVPSTIDGLKKHDRAYLAHEYFNHHWTAFYHSEVVEELTPAILPYCGTLDILTAFVRCGVARDEAGFHVEHAVS
jgi:hypothetical protein